MVAPKDQNADAKFSRYLFEYYHDGSWWNLIIPARSIEDALERINIVHRARLLGTVEAKIPAIAGSKSLSRIICWWQNLGG